MSLLQPIRSPLEFALKPGVALRMKGLDVTLKSAVQRMEGRVDAAQMAQLKGLVEGVKGFDALDERARVEAVRRALDVLATLEGPLQGASSPAQVTPPAPASPRTDEPAAAAPRKPARARAAAEPSPPPVRDPLAASVRVLTGVGPRLAATLQERGLSTLADLLRMLPRAYEDRTAPVPIATLEHGQRVMIAGHVHHAGPSGFGGRRRYEVTIADATGRVRLTWFQFNTAQMEKRFPLGMRVVASGPISRFGPHKQMVHPEVTALEEGEDPGAGVVPVYSDVDGVPRARLRKLVQAALEHVKGRIPEVLPPAVLAPMNLPTMEEALALIHQPPADTDVERLNLKDTAAHRRIAFEEFFIMQLALGRRRRGMATQKPVPVRVVLTPDQVLERVLPFKPTGAQARVTREIADDLARSEPMTRLLQGDVGSGKTAVAAAACFMAVQAGAQAAVVAPTEILAEQHFRNLTRMLAPLGIATDLVTGSQGTRERVSSLARLQQGVTQVVVGTHALLMEPVAFRRLGVACIDEQHRFGVEQRKALMDKGPVMDGVHCVPHLLVMTATPIPRTLALTLYGDLDISVLDEMPPGRKPVVTRVVTPKTRQRALDAVKAALSRGRQVYVVYPLVEESEKSDLLDATQGAEEMRGHFPGTRVELLHGRMSAAEKDAAMQRFIRREAGILVSTTVIEVGVDVPNATVMWIEHAERFGLSQLHQLRGRVGRGSEDSECFLVARGKGSEDAQRRLQIMAETQDGFRVAEEDLAIRGPGDFLGTRQSGAPPHLYANLLRHGAMMEDARRHAMALLAADPELEEQHHRALRDALEERYAERLDLARAG